MEVCFNGYGENVVTFEADETVTKGVPVMLTANGKVSAASGVFCGVCVGVRNGYAAVQLAGYVELPVDTAPAAVGYAALSAVTGGKVTADPHDGREYLVIYIEQAQKKIGLIL